MLAVSVWDLATISRWWRNPYQPDPPVWWPLGATWWRTFQRSRLSTALLFLVLAVGGFAVGLVDEEGVEPTPLMWGMLSVIVVMCVVDLVVCIWGRPAFLVPPGMREKRNQETG